MKNVNDVRNTIQKFRTAIINDEQDFLDGLITETEYVEAYAYNTEQIAVYEDMIDIMTYTA